MKTTCITLCLLIKFLRQKQANHIYNKFLILIGSLCTLQRARKLVTVVQETKPLIRSMSGSC